MKLPGDGSIHQDLPVCLLTCCDTRGCCRTELHGGCFRTFRVVFSSALFVNVHTAPLILRSFCLWGSVSKGSCQADGVNSALSLISVFRRGVWFCFKALYGAKGNLQLCARRRRRSRNQRRKDYWFTEPVWPVRQMRILKVPEFKAVHLANPIARFSAF